MNKCVNCGKETFKHSKGMCITCYKKLLWKPKKIICKRCGREKINHSKGYCNPCYSFLFHYDNIKKHNYRKWHNIGLEQYKKVTENCQICGFDKVVELHHLDKNHKNNSEFNLVGLCPNHHKMIHMFDFKQEIFSILKEKGFKIPLPELNFGSLENARRTSK